MTADDPTWFQRAIFYEVLVRGFRDSNGDGTGDLRGVTEKLDYLEWLGVDCLWLLPFYQSPLRDGGYDISDFFTVLPEYGTVGDAAELIDEAHRRGIRVIADMVMNHTSDQHPWFQESRQSRTNPKHDWYVWNDDNERWSEARIIFVDTEPSNWTWDAQREPLLRSPYTRSRIPRGSPPDVPQEFVSLLRRRYWRPGYRELCGAQSRQRMRIRVHSGFPDANSARLGFHRREASGCSHFQARPGWPKVNLWPRP